MADVVTEAALLPKDPQMKRWKFLAVGALLAWLLLVHLLVNVWLLLLFSAVMAAVGAWLGPQFILGSSTPIHLERFVTLERGARSADAEDQLDKEIRLTIQKIVQDFVSSWYRRLSPGTAFEDEVRGVMWALGMELKRRLRCADRDQLTRKLLVLAGCHLQCYKWAKARTEGVSDPREKEALMWEAYQELSPAHPALSGSAQEVSHARWLVELLLSELVPRPHLDTRTGRHLVVELISCNVVLPLVGRMSDPDWINIILTNVFSKTPLKMEEEKYESLAPPSIPKSLPLDPPPQLILPTPPSSQSSGFTVVDGEEAEPDEVPDGGEELFSVQYLQPPNSSSPFFLCDESEPESPMSELGRELEHPLMNSTEDLLSDCGLDSLTPAESPGAPPPNDEESPPLAPVTPPLASVTPPLASVTPPRPEILIESSAAQSEFTTLTNNKDGCSPMDTSPLITSSPTAPAPQITSSPTAPAPQITSSPTAPAPQITSSPTAPAPQITSSPTVPIHPFSFIPLSSPDGPVLIQNLRITGTITAREHSGTGSHPYTLYTIKYDTALDSQSLGTLQPMAYHTVNRRYREFLNLQTRLEERADLRKFIKHIKGPKKFLPDLPFGNMDSDKVEARKGQLEAFLRQLCAVPEIASSEEVQEFLALNTDARIAFVKKPFLVSRIDKIVVNAIVDTLKTAFPRSEPQSPTDELSENEVDGKSQNDKRSTKSRLRFPSSKIAPVLTSCDVQEKILYSVREGGTISEVLSLAGMESFIQKQEKILNEISCSHEQPIGTQQLPSTLNVQVTGLDGGLSAVALEVLWLVMREQWSWLCTDNMQKVTHLLCGSLIQRWLEVQVDNFTCMQRWALYLRLLRQAIWPGGALRAQPRPPRTQTQRDTAYHQALQSLMGIIPDLVQEILGVQKCRQAWKSILDSLQHPVINRHLLYCIWDVLLESLISTPTS